MEDNYSGYEFVRTILNDIEEIDDFLKLTLTSGEEVYGRSDAILFESDDDEDDECHDETEYLMFRPYGEELPRFFRENDIESFEIFTEADIPKKDL